VFRDNGPPVDLRAVCCWRVNTGRTGKERGKNNLGTGHYDVERFCCEFRGGFAKFVDSATLMEVGGEEARCWGRGSDESVFVLTLEPLCPCVLRQDSERI